MAEGNGRIGLIASGRSKSDARLVELQMRVDELDRDLVDLLNERASCSAEIAAIKRVLGIAVYQLEREEHVVAHANSVNDGPLAWEALTRVFQRIIEETRQFEEKGEIGPGDIEDRGDRGNDDRNAGAGV